MKKLFIHTPIFRFLSPIFSGIVTYLLILLINNNIGQLQEQFLGQELYVCIALAYIVHEFSRFLLWLFKQIPKFLGTTLMLLLHMGVSLVLSAAIITLIFSIYYKYVSGFSPSIEELLTFNSIFCSIPVAYVLLNLSHEYLYKINTKKMKNELLIKENIEEDFKQFKKEINPDLLFESFETMLILIKEDKNEVDDFIDNLATLYRYILASKKNQLTPINEELFIVDELIKLYNHLPYRKIKISVVDAMNFLIVPGSLLFTIEQIIKTTIVSTKVDLEIKLQLEKENYSIVYKKEDKITDSFSVENLKEILKVYSIYSKDPILINEENEERVITIPILNIKN